MKRNHKFPWNTEERKQAGAYFRLLTAAESSTGKTKKKICEELGITTFNGFHSGRWLDDDLFKKAAANFDIRLETPGEQKAFLEKAKAHHEDVRRTEVLKPVWDNTDISPLAREKRMAIGRYFTALLEEQSLNDKGQIAPQALARKKKAVCAKVGVSFVYFDYLTSGEDQITTEIIQRIASAFGYRMKEQGETKRLLNDALGHEAAREAAQAERRRSYEMTVADELKADKPVFDFSNHTSAQRRPLFNDHDRASPGLIGTAKNMPRPIGEGPFIGCDHTDIRRVRKYLGALIDYTLDRMEEKASARKVKPSREQLRDAVAKRAKLEPAEMQEMLEANVWRDTPHPQTALALWKSLEKEEKHLLRTHALPDVRLPSRIPAVADAEEKTDKLPGGRGWKAARRQWEEMKKASGANENGSQREGETASLYDSIEASERLMTLAQNWHDQRHGLFIPSFQRQSGRTSRGR